MFKQMEKGNFDNLMVVNESKSLNFTYMLSRVLT